MWNIKHFSAPSHFLVILVFSSEFWCAFSEVHFRSVMKLRFLLTSDHNHAAPEVSWIYGLGSELSVFLRSNKKKHKIKETFWYSRACLKGRRIFYSLSSTLWKRPARMKGQCFILRDYLTYIMCTRIILAISNYSITFSRR